MATKSTHPHWVALEHAFEDGTDEDFLRYMGESLEAIGEKKVGYIPSYFVRRLLAIAEQRGEALYCGVEPDVNGLDD